MVFRLHLRVELRQFDIDHVTQLMALLIALHDEVSPRGIGEAINFLDREGKCRRINRVRYYTFADFKRALTATVKDPAKKKAALDLFEAKPGTKR